MERAVLDTWVVKPKPPCKHARTLALEPVPSWHTARLEHQDALAATTTSETAPPTAMMIESCRLSQRMEFEVCEILPMPQRDLT